MWAALGTALGANLFANVGKHDPPAPPPIDYTPALVVLSGSVVLAAIILSAPKGR